MEHNKKEIHLGEDATIADLSNEITGLSGIPKEYQILIFGDGEEKQKIKAKRELDRPISDFGLCDDSVVEFRGNLAGGCGCHVGCGCEIM
jgi:hypothetical protein